MLAVALSVPVPEQAGEYEVRLWAEQEDVPIRAAEATVRLTVAASAATSDSSRRADVLHAALTEAERLRCLPDDYLDVSEGWLARVKRWLKRKLLTNFKRGYVDVLSRRQSAFNRQMLAAVRALAEAHLQDKPTSDGGDNPRREVAALRETLARLEQRLLQLEARASSVEEVRI
jgi:hypothetical protein